MPAHSRVMVRTGMVWLVVGSGLAVAMAMGLEKASAALWPVYLHLLTVGWITNLIFGVALWIFPRVSRSHPYGSPGLVWLTYISLNVGLLLRAVSEPLFSFHTDPLARGLFTLSGFLMLLSAVGFVMASWRRVRAR